MYNYLEISERYRLQSCHAWFKLRQGLVIWAVSKYCSPVTHFLEIGVGTGIMTAAIAKAFPHAMICGSDQDKANLLFLRDQLHIKNVVQFDAKHMPLLNAFDLIGTFDVLEHIQEDVAVLKQIHTALKPGGHVIITVPQHPFLWSSYDEHDSGFGCHVRRYTRKELHSKLKEAGFCAVHTTSFVSFLLPVMALTRLLPSSKPHAPARGVNPSAFSSFCMEQIFRFEALLIRMGVRFCAGGSLLVVAKKQN